MIKPGDLVKDGITGFTGIVVARTEWLNHCIRCTVQPRELKDGKPVESQTFDEEQLEVLEPQSFVSKAFKAVKEVLQTGGDRDDKSALRRD